MSTNTHDKESQVLDHKDILGILPHRYPFLLVDKIIDINLEEKFIIGQKNLTMNEHFFQGHFPSHPIMPGVLILEALAQTGGVYIHLKGFTKLAALLSINNAKFRKPVYPGDVLTLRAKEQFISSKGARFYGTAMVGDKVAAEAEIGCVLMEENNIRLNK